MKINDIHRIRTLLDRIGRASASQDWGDNLNPAQRAVLAYLSSANRFSRAPSNIAEYMCATRGTTSQTLKALERKGLVSQSVSPTDKRSVSFEITFQGKKMHNVEGKFETVLENINNKEASVLLRSLESIVHQLLAVRGYKSFGICKDCKYHEKKRSGRFCGLLKIDLTQEQTTQLCHEQVPAHIIN